MKIDTVKKQLSKINNLLSSIEMDGVLSVSGENSTIDQLFLKGDGVLNVAMNDVLPPK